METNAVALDAIAVKVRRIIAETLRVSIDQIGIDASLDEERLGLDSLGLIKLNVALEDAFDIALPDFTRPEQPAVRSVSDVVAIVAAKVHSQAHGGAS